MATYNGGRYLREQVDSILIQLGEEDELIVSDDGSTDDTIGILKGYNDNRIHIFTNNNRKGVIGNFENAIRQAKGIYIFLADQDDLWLQGKVKKCVMALQNADLVLHDAAIWNGDKIINDSFFKLRGVKHGYLKNIVKNSYIGCCMAFNKKLKETVLPMPEVAMHDMYIGLVGERRFKTVFLAEPLILYRRHGKNASATGEKSSFSRAYQLKYRIKMFLSTITK